MKPVAIAGIVLIGLGILALVYQGISWTTTEQIVDIGPLEVREQDTESLPLPPIVGAVAVLAGAGLLWAGAKK